MTALPRTSASLLCTLAAMVCFALPALAAVQAAHPNDPTKPAFVAMLYQRLIGKRPDFSAWVEKMPDYIATPASAQPKMMEEKAKDMADTFNMLTGLEPIYVNAYVPIDGYDAQKKAYYIKNFDKYAFYNYVYLGKNYAVIPHGIENYQWLLAAKDKKDLIWNETDGGKTAHIQLTLIPRSADPEKLAIGDKYYHLVMTNVLKVELWSRDNSHIIWDDSENQPGGTKHLLLELYQ